MSSVNLSKDVHSSMNIVLSCHSFGRGIGFSSVLTAHLYSAGSRHHRVKTVQGCGHFAVSGFLRCWSALVAENIMVFNDYYCAYKVDTWAIVTKTLHFYELIQCLYGVARSGTRLSTHGCTVLATCPPAPPRKALLRTGLILRGSG